MENAINLTCAKAESTRKNMETVCQRWFVSVLGGYSDFMQRAVTGTALMPTSDGIVENSGPGER